MLKQDTNPDKVIEETLASLADHEANLRTIVQQVVACEQANGHLSSTQATSATQAPSLSQLRYLHQQIDNLIHQYQTLNQVLEATNHPVPASSFPLSRVQMFQRQEEERARTAKDLEETTGQLLANAIFELAGIKQLITTQSKFNTLIEGIEALQAELEQGLADFRFLISDLDPTTALGSFGLVAGVRRYLEKFSAQTKIKTAYEAHTILEDLSDTIEIAIFRIIQEALHNVHHHAKATHVQVRIDEIDNQLIFTVTDNGIGFQPRVRQFNQAERHLGLVAMKDLADLLDGQLTVKSDDQGTQVALTMPYPRF